MSIAYAGGTNVNTTFICTTGTRREIVDGIASALATAGWSYVSGQGTGTVIMRSASTPSAGNSIDVRLHDPGSGNCAQVRIQNAAASLNGQACYLLPGVGKVYRVIANRYQFFCFTEGGTAAREFIMVCVPWLPSFLVGPINGDFGVINGNANSDTDSTVRPTFRTGPSTGTSTTNVLWWTGILNGVMLNRTANSTDSCDLRLVVPYTAFSDDPQSGYLWHDGSSMLSEPLLAFAVTDAESSKIRGQIWDAVWCSEMFAGDLTSFSFDSHTWYSITNNNPGYSNYARGTLLHMIP